MVLRRHLKRAEKERRATRLKDRLADLNWTRARLAEAVGVRENLAGQWARGERWPQPDMEKRVATALGVAADYFTKAPAIPRLRVGNDERRLRKGLLTPGVGDRLATWLLKKFVGLQRLHQPAFRTPISMESREDLAMAGVRLRRRWKLGDQPVGDLPFLLARHGILVDVAPADVPLPVDQPSVCGRFANFGFIVVGPQLSSDPVALRFAIAMDVSTVLFTWSDRSSISKPNRRRFARWFLLPELAVREFVLNHTRLRANPLAFGDAARLLGDVYGLPVEEVTCRIREVWDGTPVFETQEQPATATEPGRGACDAMRGWMRWLVARRSAEGRLSPDAAQEVLHRLETANPTLHFRP